MNDAYEALLKQIDDLKAQVKNLTNVARHNYQCAVREQLHARDHDHDPLDEYPPLVDDEYKAALDRVVVLEGVINNVARAMTSDPHAVVAKGAEAAVVDGVLDLIRAQDILVEKVDKLADQVIVLGGKPVYTL